MRIVIFASSKFSIPLLEKLHKSEHEICAVYSQPPSISGRGMKLKENEVCLKSRELNLKLLFPDNINKDIEIFVEALIKIPKIKNNPIRNSNIGRTNEPIFSNPKGIIS